MKRIRVAVVQFPGVNCETETVRALAQVGLETDLVRWTRPASELRDYGAFVLPGGFSYQDRVRAGALAAKDPMLEVLAEEAARGRPVLGICNGAQVLVEAGLVPGTGAVELALATNRMPGRRGYYARWVQLRVEPSPCIFTRHLRPGTVLALPVAHGEGRFTGSKRKLAELVRSGRAPLRYATADGMLATAFPDNPNGSEEAVAAVCNAAGNVLAMMPHPERAQEAGAVPRTIAAPDAAWPGVRRTVNSARQKDADVNLSGGLAHGAPATASTLDRPGPGLALFEGLRRHLEGE